MASHIVLEESGEKYEPKKVDLAGGEQRTEAYLKINPLGRVPALRLSSRSLTRPRGNWRTPPKPSRKCKPSRHDGWCIACNGCPSKPVPIASTK